MMKLCTFVLFCKLFSPIAAFVVPDGFTELKTNSNLPSIVHKYDKCEGLDCSDNGECAIIDNHPTCKCYFGYEGENCEIDRCEGLDCNSNGECEIIDEHPTCKCYDRYEGIKCEIDKCEGLDCNGNGEWEIMDNHPTCKCYNSYEGIKCEIYKCEGLDCNANGECEIIDNHPTCTCYDRYEGKNCEIDKCEDLDCNGNGDCEIIDNHPNCKCYDRYEGIKCEIDSCKGLYCNGKGECEIVDNHPTCKCYDRYEGIKCEIDKCEGLDCNGKGECEIVDNHPTCKCYDRNEGIKCEIDKCERIDCNGNGECDIMDNHPTCKCYDRYAGNNCEIVNIDWCISERPKCIDTGGTCKFDSEVLKYIKCVCPNGSFFIEHEGCIVPCKKDNTCDGSNRQCNKNNFCVCLEGYEGENCDVVIGCKILKKKCDEIEKDCIFDKHAPEKAVCQCDDGFVYDRENNKCEIPCKKDNTCDGSNRQCNKNNFCVCLEGYEGENCDVVIGCKILKKKCDEIEKDCIFDKHAPEKAVCQCDDGFVYDRENNKCEIPCKKDNTCDGSNRQCNKNNFCVCLEGYEGENCDVVIGCKILKKKCDEIEKDCIFDKHAPEKTVCQCDDGFVYDRENNKCEIPCKKDNTCDGSNRQCNKNNFCVCLEGYEGENCDVVIGCKNLKKKCDEIEKDCIFDNHALEKAVCQCDDGFVYDRENNKCEKGYEGENCDVVIGCKNLKKKCDEIEKDCIFDNHALEKAVCQCDDGFVYDRENNKCEIPCKKDNTCDGSNRQCNKNYFCVCLEGYEGENCDVVIGCKNLKKKCDEIDKDCIFDKYAPEKAVCQCDDGFVYDRENNKCDIPCNKDNTCDGPNRECNKNNFCVCLEGYEGDNCDVVTGCKNLIEKCDEIEKECIFDKDAPEKAVCQCDDGFVYDREYNKCEIPCTKDNNCDSPNRQCNKNYFCVCLEGYEGENCDVVIGCKYLKKKCDEIKKECIFDKDVPGKAVCQCDDGFAYHRENNKCEIPCKKDDTCGPNKECNENNFCVCLEGYEGDNCDVVTGCKNLQKKCDEIEKECIFDKDAPAKAVCQCDDGFVYDRDYNKCEIPCNKVNTCDGLNRECDENNFCVCLEGYEGENCDVVTGCKNLKEKCDEIEKECIFDKDAPEKAVCQCDDVFAYDRENNECEIPAVPRNLRATCYRNTSICLKWDEPLVLKTPILSYEIRWLNSSGSGWERSVSNNTSHTVKHLAPFVEYSFRVAAVTKSGTRKMSENLDIRTAVGVPYAPRNLTVTRMTNNTAELIWNEPFISTGPIITYRVHWQNWNSTGEEETRSTATFYTVRNLTPNINYTFKITALTEAGPGEWSKRVTGQTKHGDKCALVKCQNDGKCEVKGDEAVCSCADSYMGKYCETDKCLKVTCQNGGKCIIKRGKAVCKCTDKYTGNFCETDLASLDDPDDNIFISVFFKNRSLSTDSKLDFHFSRKETSNRTITQLLLRLNSKSVVRPPEDKCLFISCKNGGTCEVKNDKATCTCLDEYIGDHCEKSKCSLLKCQNNGKCQLKNGKEICSCTDNYSGEFCENHKCSLIKCKNGGECQIKYGKPVCICPDSYTGDYCETDKCSLVGCKNGGKCYIRNGQAIYNCVDNYTGDLCETDKCSLIRCHNGGKCSIKNGKAVCVCNDEHIGDFCEIDKCSLIRCLNGGKCEIKNQKSVCICIKEYTGDNCEKRLISKGIFRAE